MTDDWVLLPDARTLDPGKARRYPLPDGRWIALCRAEDGAFHACDDACPHAGGPLSRGVVRGGRIVCPVHRWSFDLSTGVGDENLPAIRLRLHEVRCEGEQVWIRPGRPRPRNRRDDLMA